MEQLLPNCSARLYLEVQLGPAGETNQSWVLLLCFDYFLFVSFFPTPVGIGFFSPVVLFLG